MSLRLLLVLLSLLPVLAGPGMAQYATPTEPQAMIILGVAINGNRITKEHIIMRELVVQEGDTVAADLFYAKLERSRQNLVNTGLFNTVTVLPLYIDMQQVIMEVTVGERWYLWPSPIFELADPNFNTWWLTKDLSRINYGLYLTRFNFRGRNETVYLLAQFGYTKQFAMRYKVPFFDKQQRWGLSVGGSLLEQSEVTAGTLENDRILVANPSGPNRQERMADVQLDLRRRHDVRHNWRLGFVQAEVTDTITTIAPDYFDGAAQATRFLTFGYSLTWDRRDVRFFPREGHLAEFRADRFGLGLLDRSSPDITTLQASVKRWWRMSEKVTLALSMRGKYTFGTPPYYVQEGLGYRHYVRGYEYYVIDGEHFALGKTNFILQLVAPREYRVESIPMEAFRTIYFALYLDLYADVGRVWDGRYAATNFLANEWMSGYGVGLDLVSSYDQVVRAEYSLNALGQHGFFLHFTQPF